MIITIAYFISCLFPCIFLLNKYKNDNKDNQSSIISSIIMLIILSFIFSFIFFKSMSWGKDLIRSECNDSSGYYSCSYHLVDATKANFLFYIMILINLAYAYFYQTIIVDLLPKKGQAFVILSHGYFLITYYYFTIQRITEVNGLTVYESLSNPNSITVIVREIYSLSFLFSYVVVFLILLVTRYRRK